MPKRTPKTHVNFLLVLFFIIIGVVALVYFFNNTATTVARTDEALVDDIDQDGFNDEIDLCLDTPVGAVIDNFGCALTDTDRDGVEDNLDFCVNTGAGQSVNQSGCSSEDLGFLDESGMEFTLFGVNITTDVASRVVLNEANEKSVHLIIEQAEDATADSTQVTINGLTPSITYYLYKDTNDEPEILTSSESGSVNFTQDISSKHDIRLTDGEGTCVLDGINLPAKCTDWTFDGTTYVAPADVYDGVLVKAPDLTVDFLTNNTVIHKGSPSPIGLRVNANNVIVKGGHFVAGTEGMWNSCLSTAMTSNITFDGVSCDQTLFNGASVSESDYVSIINSTFTGDPLQGRPIDSSGIVANAILYNGTGNGNITNNTITGKWYSGVMYVNSSLGVVSGNTVSNSDLNGILLAYSTQMSVENNSLSQIPSNGIYVMAGGGVDFVNNTVVGDGSGTMVGLAILYSQDSTVDGGSYTNGVVGASIHNSSNITISNGASFSQNTSEGIDVVESTGLSLNGSDTNPILVTNNGNYGLYLLSSSSSASYLNVDSNGITGILISDDRIGSIGPKDITNSTISNHGTGVGLFVSAALDVHISDSEVNGNMVGIRYFDTIIGGEVMNVNSHDNILGGIWVGGLYPAGKVRIRGNSDDEASLFENNGEYGIRVDTGASAVIGPFVHALGNGVVDVRLDEGSIVITHEPISCRTSEGAYQCPVFDTDGDGIDDDNDMCPDVPGEARFLGCVAGIYTDNKLDVHFLKHTGFAGKVYKTLTSLDFTYDQDLGDIDHVVVTGAGELEKREKNDDDEEEEDHGRANQLTANVNLAEQKITIYNQNGFKLPPNISIQIFEKDGSVENFWIETNKKDRLAENLDYANGGSVNSLLISGKQGSGLDIDEHVQMPLQLGLTLDSRNEEIVGAVLQVYRLSDFALDVKSLDDLGGKNVCEDVFNGLNGVNPLYAVDADRGNKMLGVPNVDNYLVIGRYSVYDPISDTSNSVTTCDDVEADDFHSDYDHDGVSENVAHSSMTVMKTVKLKKGNVEIILKGDGKHTSEMHGKKKEKALDYFHHFENSDDEDRSEKNKKKR